MSLYEAKSFKPRQNHHEFVYALIPFSKRIVEERGHAHVVVELNCPMQRVLDCLEKGFGLVLVALAVEEDSTEAK